MKKNKIKIIFLVTAFIYFIFCNSVFAYSYEEEKIINNNGVELSIKEFNFVNEFYGRNFFKNMTKSDYEWLKELNINISDVEIKSSLDYPIMPLSTSHSTSSKKITIAKSCSTNCTIITSVTWLTSPKIRSYDVIGARFSGTSLVGSSITTKVSSSGGSVDSSNIKELSNGFGASVKLPTSNNITIQQKFIVKSGGIVFASYQHATKDISLSTSKLYSIASNGLGGVFSFYSSALDIYDGMQGVYITT